MEPFAILAEAARTVAQDPNAPSPIIQTAWDQITKLELVSAITFVSFGLVCLVYGWRIFKILVMICFGLAGLLAGVLINQNLIGGNVVWVCVLTIALLVGISYPFMKWGVCILGGIAGGILTSGMWMAFELPPQFIWAGGLTGLVAGGMISFAAFKSAVMLFTCLQGSILLAMGGLAIFYDYLPGRDKLQAMVFEQKWFLPVVLVAPLLIGLVIQYKLSKGEEVSPSGGGSGV
jgi:hypothetical protein